MNDNNSSQGTKKKKQVPKANILESLKDLGTTPKPLNNDLLGEGAKDIMAQIMGNTRMRPINRSGEVRPGESISMKDVASGRHEEVTKLRNQVALERRLRQEEKELRSKKSGELQVQLNALMEEIQALASTTQNLAEETQVAAMSAPVEPGEYHIAFFEKLLSFLKSYRKKIEQASTWLHASNQRTQKKNYWAQYKKHGSTFLLSPDHYLTRSAG